MTDYVIHPLVVGANETDQGVMTYLKGYGRRIWIPIYVFFIEGGDKKILVDTGLEEFMVPPEIGEQYGVDVLEFEEALDKVNCYGTTGGQVERVHLSGLGQTERRT